MESPDGYRLYGRRSPYLELIGPVFEKSDGSGGVALRIGSQHVNGRGFVHAGVLVALADVVMGHLAHREAPVSDGLVTVSLTTDFAGSCRVGDWVEGVASVRHKGRRLAFSDCRFSVEGRLVLAASGVFASVQRRAS